MSNPTSGNTSSLAPDQIDNVQMKLALDQIFGSATEDWTGWKLTMAAEDSNGSPDMPCKSGVPTARKSLTTAMA